MGFISKFIADGLLTRIERAEDRLRTYHVEQMAQAIKLKELEARVRALEGEVE